MTQTQKIVVIPHEGLGDIAVIYNAILKLSEKYREVYIVARRWVTDSIEQILHFPKNVYFIEYDLDKNYRIDSNFMTKLKKKGRVLALGKHSGDPIFLYPNSFYIKLGVNPKHASDFINLKPGIHSSIQNLDLPSEYCYVNLLNSTHQIQLEHISGDYIEFLSSDQIKIVKTVRGEQNFDSIHLSKESSLAANIAIALKAKMILVSDAGFFNIIYRLKDRPPIRVFTRAHTHTHNSLIYPYDHDGEAHNL